MTILEATSPRSDHRASARQIWLLTVVLSLLLLSALSLRFGLRPISWHSIWDSFVAYDATNANHLVLQEMRLPRLLAAWLAGAALAGSGALIQSLTRNPLADPGLLGINGGASLGVILCIFLLGISDPASFVWVAMGGGLISTVLVFFLGGAGQGTPLRLILAGAALSALFLALGRSLLLISQRSLDVYRFWVLGGLDGIEMATLAALLPFFALGATLAAVSSFNLNAMMLGEDTARSLGLRVGLTRGLAVCAIVCLCGATVSMAGPIAFVGLIVPHMARRFSGADMRWCMLFSALLGAGLMILADLMGRLPVFGGNMQAGVMAALLGGPALVWLIRRNGRAAL
ncbi:iron chelate uptake ABC transporter family permease subunit [Pseudophaeobacter sp.]|uniref:FecCD family ABC transporter permease n=1 Tax=Pseudophaeobacter sp. TaxID=1971739 RepID=UPI0032631759